jgi:AcrR family transcriptional regulator
MEHGGSISSVPYAIGPNARQRKSMPKKKPVEDRRIQRTRALLQNALVSLMIEKAYESITVQEIIDRANVGRATFYAHFADKKTLLTSRIEDLRGALLRQQREALSVSGNGVRTFSFSRAMLEHANDNLMLWRRIAGRESGTFVLARIQDMLAELVRNDVAALGLTRKSPDSEALVQHLTGGFVALMMWWLNEGARLSAKDIDERFTRLAMLGLAAFLPESRARAVRWQA